MKNGVRLAAIVIVGTVVTGCASSGNDFRAMQDRLVATGMSAGTAKCVVDGMVDKFGTSRLGARVQPTPEELAAQKVIVRRCKRTAK